MKTDIRKKYLSKPTAVQLAVTVLWITFGINILNTFFVATHPAPLLPGSIVMQFVLFGIDALFIAAIARGRNWARILFLILCPLGLVSVVLGVHLLTRLHGSLSFSLELGQSILQNFALFLLFQRESSEWFRGGQRPELTARERMIARGHYSYARYE